MFEPTARGFTICSLHEGPPSTMPGVPVCLPPVTQLAGGDETSFPESRSMEPGPWGALPVLARTSGGFGALTGHDCLQSPWVLETTSSEDFSLRGGWNWDHWTSLRDLA